MKETRRRKTKRKKQKGVSRRQHVYKSRQSMGGKDRSRKEREMTQLRKEKINEKDNRRRGKREK